LDGKKEGGARGSVPPFLVFATPFLVFATPFLVFAT
jgi:hypothetical protein